MEVMRWLLTENPRHTARIYAASINYVCEANVSPWALHKEVHISCIAKRVAENGVNSNFLPDDLQNILTEVLILL